MPHHWCGRPPLRPREGRVRQRPWCGPRLTRHRWRILVTSLLIDWRGVRSCCRLVPTREVGPGIRGVLLLLLTRRLGRSGPRLPLRTCDFARLVVLLLPSPLPVGSRLPRFLPLLHRLCVKAVDLAFLRDRRPRGVALTACPLQNAVKSVSGSRKGKEVTQIDNGLKSRLTTEMYPGSGRILISQRSFASSGNSATAFLALRVAMPRGCGRTA